MKKNCLLTVFFFVLGLLIHSPLHAMKVEGEKKGIKASTIYNRSERDRCLTTQNYVKAVLFAQKVIHEDPEAADNEDVTLDDFRIARDLYFKLPEEIRTEYLDDATTYAQGATEFETANENDYMQARALFLKSGDYKQAAYYNSILPDNL